MRNRNIFVPIPGIFVSLHMGEKSAQSGKGTSALTLVLGDFEQVASPSWIM